MTNKELMEQLDALGAEYNKDANKAELEQLLGEALAAKAAETAQEAAIYDAGDPEAAEGETGAEKAAKAPQRAVRIVRAAPTDPAAKLNVRTCPNGSVLTAVASGTELQAVGEPEDGWQRVLLDAWVAADLVM